MARKVLALAVAALLAATSQINPAKAAPPRSEEDMIVDAVEPCFGKCDPSAEIFRWGVRQDLKAIGQDAVLDCAGFAGTGPYYRELYASCSQSKSQQQRIDNLRSAIRRSQ